MKIGRRIGLAIAACAASIVVGCGGGGGGEPTAGSDRGGITIAQGAVSGFGSVIVNGVHYSTGTAAITIDDRPGAESELRVGHVVRVTGTVDANGTTGTARSISFDYDVEGPVQSIDLAGSSMFVAGQTVQVGPGTSFDDSLSAGGLENLQPGDPVEVSGLRSSNNVIDATRVERGSLFRQALVARRQQSHFFSAETVNDFEPEQFHQMAGLVCYYNSFKFHYLHISHDESSREAYSCYVLPAGPDPIGCLYAANFHSRQRAGAFAG